MKIIIVIGVLILLPIWLYIVLRLSSFACFKSWKEVSKKNKNNKNEE